MKLQYPKLLALSLCIIAAYILFRADFFKDVAALFNSHGYISIFFAGFLFAYGFTAPFAVGFFAELSEQVNTLPAALLAGFGALAADLLIFQFIRTSFQDEFDKLKLIWIIRKLQILLHNFLTPTWKKYLIWSIAGFLIASPLPDEFGVSLLGGFTNIRKKTFIILSYLLNTGGIFVILSLAS